MKLTHRFLVTALVAMAVSAVVGLTVYQTQSSPTHPLDQIMPEGALLYIEAKDFSGLMKDWNASPEKSQWLKSDDYRVFSNSRLFLRLSKASDEFAVAAGVPPNMKFLNDAAGKESALAIYNIGELEFLYVSRINNSAFLQSPLWQTRSKFQPCMAGGKSFYTRKDEQSGMEVAFAVADDYLILGTRRPGGRRAGTSHRKQDTYSQARRLVYQSSGGRAISGWGLAHGHASGTNRGHASLPDVLGATEHHGDAELRKRRFRSIS